MFGRKRRDDAFELLDDGWLDSGNESGRSSRKQRSLTLALLAAMALAAAGLWYWQVRSAALDTAGNSRVIETAPALQRTQSAGGETAPIVSPTVTEPVPTVIPTDDVGRYEPDALAVQMLQLINADRAANGLGPVAWDEIAAEAGRRHTADMIRYGYFSHWNREGLGPDHRYTLAGGRHAVMENLHTLATTYSDGRGAPIEDWSAVIHNAQQGLMNSPGHRANILDPAHTHVGIGMAYDAASGQFRLAQEFTNQYVNLATALPIQITAASTVSLEGSVQTPRPEVTLDQILFELAYEPLPGTLTLEQLAATSSYGSAAQSRRVWRGANQFSERVPFGGDWDSGIYHLRIFADLDGEQALVLDHCIWFQP